MLIGHEHQRADFLSALNSGRLHHAWLLTGPRGIGKRRFADWAALKLLADDTGPDDVSPGHPVARLVAAGSHPDHRVLAPPVEGKGSATSTITVNEVRAHRDFLQSHPSMANWRVMIVDSIDDMNLNTANAFLKLLEEPRPNTLYLMTSHAPGGLLATIRSRCRRMAFDRLPDTQTRQVLASLYPDLPEQQLASLAGVANGAPGAVLELGEADIGDLEQWIGRLLRGDDAISFARTFADKAAASRLKALLTMATQRIAAIARRNPHPQILDLYDSAETLLRDAIRLAYDRVQVAMAVADLLARAGRMESGNS